MRKYCFVVLFLAIIAGCGKTELKDDIVGHWLVISECDSCILFEFSKGGDLIIESLKENDTEILRYVIYQNGTILIANEISSNTYDIIFHDKDEVEIKGFNFTPIPEEMNTFLNRLIL